MRVRIDLSYIGDDFCGWQIQPGLKTVQGELTAAVKSLTGEDVTVTGSGRTDTGVHALCQTAHFDLKKDFDLNKLEGGLNFYLPSSVRVLSAGRATEDFHARFSARSKTYVYVFTQINSALYHNRAYCRKDLDYQKMAECADVFLGKQDFSAFRSLGSDTKTSVREIFEIGLDKRGDFTVLRVTADGFLYNMVRKIAGALIKVGEGKLGKKELREILQSKDGSSVPVAPPHALYLYKVEYPE